MPNRQSVKFAGNLLISFVLLGVVATGTALSKERADCEREYRPQFGQEGKDVPWEPTVAPLADAMLKMAGTTPRDLVIDLGSGDGVIVVRAAKRFGARAIGIEYNPDLAKLAQCYAEVEGVSDKAQIIRGDLFEYDFSKADVLTLYLYPELNLRLRPTILDMRPGIRVVSHSHLMGDWQPDDQTAYQDHRAYLWIVPAKVAGIWSFKQADGGEAFDLTLEQQYQNLTGKAQMAERSSRLQGALRGENITLSFKDGRITRRLTGTVANDRMMLSDGARSYVGTRT